MQVDVANLSELENVFSKYPVVNKIYHIYHEQTLSCHFV